MIKIENVSMAGLEPAVRGMRNPMNSWGQSDSGWCKGGNDFVDCCREVHENCPRGDGDVFLEDVFCIGKNDFDLMQRLARAGTDHRKYMRMIAVYADITAPLYWWKEFKTYRAGKRWGDDEPDMFAIPSDYLEYDIEMNSCSTMHKIHADEFTLADFSHEHLIADGLNSLKRTIDDLNACRDEYFNEEIVKNPELRKIVWWQIIQLLPSSYNQRRTIMLNYEVLANMYHARKNHKLDEWQQFCQWIESLPYSGIITGAKNGAE